MRFFVWIARQSDPKPCYYLVLRDRRLGFFDSYYDNECKASGLGL
jgi:hypothetical protein